MPGCSQFDDEMPVGLHQIATGRVTPEQSAVLVGTGGQVCYVELANATVHATPLTLRYYAEGPGGQMDLCSSTFLMPPIPASPLNH